MERLGIKESRYNVKIAKILRTRQLTEHEKLFELAIEGGEAFDYEPGQFIMINDFGVGEIPISLTSAPTNRISFEVCIRAVGKVTNAIHTLEAGDFIGIRGPYGRGFPIRILEGNDLMIVAGGLGIAPLRSLINYVLDNRRDFGKVHILLGSKSPKDMLFVDELDRWNQRMDVYYQSTVDQAEIDWTGHVGVITTLIPGVDLEPERTFAIVVGPPIMYKFVIRELLAKNIPERQIFVDFERHMKCGIGKCGRCQIQNLYVCQDGPVFSYEEIKHLTEAM
jgi:sulfhydrogenase subunit gamma (sulfur reductase)